MRLSICMVTKNAGETISSSLLPIISSPSRPADLEVCLHDVGSTDDTITIVENLCRAHQIDFEYAVTSPSVEPEQFFMDSPLTFRREFISEWTRKPLLRDISLARNFATEISSGDYALCLDAGDEPAGNTVENLSPTMSVLDQKKEISIVSSPLVTLRMSSDGEPVVVNRVLVDRMIRLKPSTWATQIRWDGVAHERLVPKGQDNTIINVAGFGFQRLLRPQDNNGHVSHALFKTLLVAFEKLEDSGKRIDDMDNYLLFNLAREAVTIIPRTARALMTHVLSRGAPELASEAHYHIAHAFDREGNYEDAIKKLDASLACGMSFNAFARRGKLRKALGRDGAEDDFQTARELREKKILVFCEEELIQAVEKAS